MNLMECISHGTRAYIVNAEGLSGFLFEFDIIKHLRNVEDAGQLEYQRKWQVIDMAKVESKLGELLSNQERMDYLS